jgi:hypothetical protein
MCNVGLVAIPSFVRGFVDCRVDKPVVEIDRMHQRRRPKLCRKPGPIKQGSNFDGQGIVVYFRVAILRGAVSTSWLNQVVKLLEHHSPKYAASRKFATLISPNKTSFRCKSFHKRPEDINGGVLEAS